MTTNAAVGSLAPDFDLPSTAAIGRSRLADYRGRWLVLIFYPRDFSLVCPTELTAIGARIEEFTRRGCDALGVSADTLESHHRWIATPVRPGRAQRSGLSAGQRRSRDRLSRVRRVSRNSARGAARLVHHRPQRRAAISGGAQPQRWAPHRRSAAGAGRLADRRPLRENWSPGEPTLDKARPLGPGTVLSHYRIEEQIGSGAFASVFRPRTRRCIARWRSRC